jgi:transcriptional regulator with XRE-family HTH domain
MTEQPEALEVKDGSDEEAVLAEVGERVKLARQSASMTQTLLAEVLSVTPTAISYWESGKRDMGVAGLLRIAEACRVPVSSLLPSGPAPDPEPSGRYGRVEMPGYRENEGWITEETRFGLQVAVVRDREGTETAAIGMGPLCRVVWLPVPETRPEPPALPPGTGWDDGPDGGDGDLGDDDDEYPGAF